MKLQNGEKVNKNDTIALLGGSFDKEDVHVLAPITGKIIINKLDSGKSIYILNNYINSDSTFINVNLPYNVFNNLIKDKRLTLRYEVNDYLSPKFHVKVVASNFIPNDRNNYNVDLMISNRNAPQVEGKIRLYLYYKKKSYFTFQELFYMKKVHGF